MTGHTFALNGYATKWPIQGVLTVVWAHLFFHGQTWEKWGYFASAMKEKEVKMNVGSIDRIARALLGVALIGATLLGWIGVWGWVGVVPLGTAVLSSCPLYALLGINSCPASPSHT